MSAGAPDTPALPAVPKKLYAKLKKARDEVQPVEKQGRNADDGYAFVRAADIVKAANEPLQKQRILVLPSVVGSRVTFDQNGRGAIAEVKMRFKVVDVSSGESIEQTWIGWGFDNPGDKAGFKAQTGAHKYFLKHLLSIPVEGDDPEEDQPPAPSEADRVRAAQDRAAEDPQLPRHEKPLPNSDHPPAPWEKEGEHDDEEAVLHA